MDGQRSCSERLGGEGDAIGHRPVGCIISNVTEEVIDYLKRSRCRQALLFRTDTTRQYRERIDVSMLVAARRTRAIRRVPTRRGCDPIVPTFAVSFPHNLCSSSLALGLTASSWIHIYLRTSTSPEVEPSEPSRRSTHVLPMQCRSTPPSTPSRTNIYQPASPSP